MMSHFDQDGSGDLNLEEFKALAQVIVVQNCFCSIAINVSV